MTCQACNGTGQILSGIPCGTCRPITDGAGRAAARRRAEDDARHFVRLVDRARVVFKGTIVNDVKWPGEEKQ